MRAHLAALCLTIAVSACGKKTSLTDAPRGDGNGADSANQIDADVKGIVTVLVLDNGGNGTPVVGQTVVFVEPNGTVEAEVPTDANGRAMGKVLPGASVTTVYVVDATDSAIKTVLGVKPGDTITIGAKKNGDPAGTFTVSAAEVPGSLSYDFYGPCGLQSVNDPGSGSPTVSATLTMNTSCNLATMDLVAVKINGSGIADAWLEKPGVAFTDGSTSLGSNWQPFQQITYSLTDIPAEVGGVIFRDFVPDFEGFENTDYNSNGGGTASGGTFVPAGATAMIETDFSNANAGGEQFVYDQVTGAPTTYSLDVGATLLPWIGVVSFDSSTAKLTVPVSGTAGGDAFEVDVQYYRPDPGGGTGSTALNDFYDWEVWSATAEDITLPTLPTDLAVNNPLSTDTINGAGGVLYESDQVTSYDQIRGNLWGGFDAALAGRGTPGRLRLSYSSSGALALRGAHHHRPARGR